MPVLYLSSVCSSQCYFLPTRRTFSPLICLFCFRLFTVAFILLIIAFGLLLRGISKTRIAPVEIRNEDRLIAEEQLKERERSQQGGVVFDDEVLFRNKLSNKISDVSKIINEVKRPKAASSNISLSRHDAHKTDVKAEKTVPRRKDKFRILFWDSLPYFLHPNEQLPLCKFKNCEVTTEKSDVKSSDAVLFYGPAHYGGNLPVKTGSQVWIYMSMESPSNVFNSFVHLNNKVNWTWTYRRDSDILASYGRILRRENPSLDFDARILANKNKSIAWFVSNCNSRSERDRYKSLLEQAHSDIDIYGRCGQLTCVYENPKCRGLLNNTYRFYLSFENSLCRDYVTEKVLAKIGSIVVPIVRGGGHYSVYLPPNSYIDTSQFKSVSQLGAKLKSIEKSAALYESFHEWRKHYVNKEFKDIVNYEEGWCDICEKLNHQSKYKRLYKDFSHWWQGDTGTSGQFCTQASDLIL
ncbi:hypothetical protein FSP39_021370 [Pinctada imbricata]|uniref:Fucosyltransferase n=1 Tax=Pinctada imbricata TaxID=66713 RepID=A0AA89C475_PINIB|nr:hypothetical protein FSP39_021370 [Pinctada imbricata]